MLSGQQSVSETSVGMRSPWVRPNPDIYIKEGGFTIKTLTEDHEKIEAYQLRHRIFAEELGWVLPSRTFMEIDEYDRHCSSIGVFDQKSRLVGFSRLILPGSTFMLERDFSSLVGAWHNIRKQSDTAEASRLCVLPEARNAHIDGNFGLHNVAMLIYKGVYHWCLRNNIRYLYLVVEQKVFRMLRAKGFRCTMVGDPLTMPDGCVAVAAILDWVAFLAENSARRPELMRWFTRYQSDHFESRLQRPEFELPFAASA